MDLSKLQNPREIVQAWDDWRRAGEDPAEQREGFLRFAKAVSEAFSRVLPGWPDWGVAEKLAGDSWSVWKKD